MNVENETVLIAWLGLVADGLTPILLAWLGFRVHAYVDRLTRRRYYSEVESRWRLETFRELVVNLNRLYCYFTYQGDWLSMTPDDATASKRTADRLVGMNRFLWSSEFLAAYEGFKEVAFAENVEPGRPFAFRANVAMHELNRSWDESWAERFVAEDRRVTRAEFTGAYDRMMELAVRDLGVLSEPYKMRSHH